MNTNMIVGPATAFVIGAAGVIVGGYVASQKFNVGVLITAAVTGALAAARDVRALMKLPAVDTSLPAVQAQKAA